MTDAIARARAATERAKEKQQNALKSYYWTIARPGQEPFWIHVNPPQEFSWVEQHYPGASIIKGKSTT